MMRGRRFVISILKGLAVAIILVFFLFPLYWVITTSFKSPNDILSWPPKFLFKPTLANYLGTTTGIALGGRAARPLNITPYLINSLVIDAISTLISTIVSAMAAYSISRFKTGGSFFINWFLSLRMLPPVVLAIPLFIFFKSLGLVNTWWGLILAYLTFNIPFSTVLLIGFFNEIPTSLDEAAYVDGASKIGTFFKVILPLGAPGLAAVTILSFLTCWGEFLLALTLTYDVYAQTVPVFLGLFITEWGILWGPMSAAAVLAIIPPVLFSLFTQRYLVKGITLGAVKY